MISVLMGTYNCKETVGAAVESILGQSNSELELVICDDASTDGTYEVLKEIQKKSESRIILLRNEKNSYLANCLNRCFDVSKGEYIARMDGDDVSLPERLDIQLSFLQSNPGIDMVGSAVEMVYDWGGRKKLYAPALPNRNTLSTEIPFFHPTILAKRAVFEHLGGYTEGELTRRSEDIDFYCRFFLAGFHGANIPEILYIKSEQSDAIKHRTPSVRFSSFRTKIRCFRMLGYPWLPYAKETLKLSKVLVPAKLLILWRKLREDKMK